MEVLKQIIGRLHPVIVHLPIGFIIAGLLLHWINRKNKSGNHIISVLFLWATISALIACLTGYLQYLGEGYTFETVKWHLWIGLITTGCCFFMYLKLEGRLKPAGLQRISLTAFAALLLVLISLTGHLGGSITHGEDYLIAPLPKKLKLALGFDVYQEKPILLSEENWEQTQFYEEVVAPILNNKCVSCHNSKKAKGALILDTEAAILKGGEKGEVVSSGAAENSPLYTRMVLPEHDEDHMPPKDKPQPSAAEIALIKTWINAELPFEGTIASLGLQKALFTPFFPKKNTSVFPDVIVAEVPSDTILRIKQLGVHIQPISNNSNLLSVSCINQPDFDDKTLKQLFSIADQITSLDLGGTKITDASIKQLLEFPNLCELKLDHTSITGAEIQLLKELKYLKRLNLTATAFKKEHLGQLTSLKSLEKVYLYKTGLEAADYRENTNDSALFVEFGNYDLPFIETDSIIY